MSYAISVPFTLSEFKSMSGPVVHERLAGVVRLEPSELVLEYRTRTMDGNMNTVEGTVRRVAVPVTHLAAVALRRRWLRDAELQLQVSSLAALADFPYFDGARCTLRVARRDATQAEELVQELQQRLADLSLRRLGEGDESEQGAGSREQGAASREQRVGADRRAVILTPSAARGKDLLSEGRPQAQRC